MSKFFIGILSVIGIFIVSILIFVIMYFSYNNSETRIRNAIVAKQRDNTSQLDNTVKVISQNAQVTSEQREALKDVIVGNAEARAGSRGSGNLATLVHEAVPNMDQTTQTYRQLMNTITAARNQWTENQRELLDLSREHNNMLTLQPSAFFCVTLGGKQPIEVTIVTSTRTEESFKTGKDDDTDLFKKSSK